MPDKDDKNSGHTSLPGEYERNEQEVHDVDHDRKPSFKGVNDREAKGARNTEDDDSRKAQREREEARSVPASKQG